MFGEWGAFRDPPCRAATRSPRRENAARDHAPFASIGTWPQAPGARAGPCAAVAQRSRPRRRSRSASAGSASRSTGGGGDAWAQDRRMDAAIVAAMRSAGVDERQRARPRRQPLHRPLQPRRRGDRDGRGDRGLCARMQVANRALARLYARLHGRHRPHADPRTDRSGARRARHHAARRRPRRPDRADRGRGSPSCSPRPGSTPSRPSCAPSRCSTGSTTAA